MVKRYFKVVIREPLKIPLTVEQTREAPATYLKAVEYKERMVEVEYSLAGNTDPEKFEKILKKVIKGNYNHVHSIEELKHEHKELTT
jgi:uncharacterized OsmC-like protein